MKTENFWRALVLILCGSVVFASGQRTTIVYDPGESAASATGELLPMVTAAEERLLERIALPRARDYWKKDEDAARCGEDFRVVDTAEGSFTRRRAAQKAFLYEFCQTGNGWANNGLVITEGDKIVAHFIEPGGWNRSLRRLPDINKNGFDELVVETSGGMRQGKIGGSVILLEVSSIAVRELGYTRAFSNVCDEENSADNCDRSYLISASPGVRPVFYKQMFVNLGDDEKTRWRKKGKLQKLALDKGENQYRLLK